MIHPQRIQQLNNKPECKGDYILYWMQQSQRLSFNHALEFAKQTANLRKLPLIIAFTLVSDFPNANHRHYAFMLQGLQQVEFELKKQGIVFLLLQDSPFEKLVELSQNASLIVTDRGYSRIQRQWRHNIANQVDCLVTQVESDVVVPIETASVKEEYSAATLRAKLLKNVSDWLQPVTPVMIQKDSLRYEKRNDFSIPKKVDVSVKPVLKITGGYSEADRLLNNFIQNKIETYPTQRNDPSLDVSSNLSPYLHFGQISPLEITLRVINSNASTSAKESFLEQLIVRRELAINFVYYNPDYDKYNAIPNWAKETLRKHLSDKRGYLYNQVELELASTHDIYWNAAMNQMKKTGSMHNYMRMYWGKKILEWSETPETAFKSMLFLNDKYFLDGRDPNSYAGIAWIFGKHDRPFTERTIFGMVRYMNDKGLERKFDIASYVYKIEHY